LLTIMSLYLCAPVYQNGRWLGLDDLIGQGEESSGGDFA